jgi:hypothetical protein
MTPEELVRRAAARRFADEQTRLKKSDGVNTGGLAGEAAEVIHTTANAIRTGRAWLKAAREIASTVAAPIMKYAGPIVRPIARATAWSFKYASCDKGPDGHRHMDHFNKKRATFGLPVWFTAAALTYSVAPAVVPAIPVGAYYYATTEHYPEIYFPGSGPWMSQQFMKPGNANLSHMRNEVFTITGKYFDKRDNDKMQVARFDIESNIFFMPFYFSEYWRPDLMAARLNSQSSNGIKCDVVATDSYTHLPPFFQRLFLKYLDFRPNLVHVGKCEELRDLPPGFFDDNRPLAKPANDVAPKDHATLVQPLRTGWNGDNSAYPTKVLFGGMQLKAG